MAITAVVVTFNRRKLLANCIAALQAQTRAPDRILIIDNASTDDTAEWIQGSGLLQQPALRYLRMDSNLGGAGGFARGLETATREGADWVWMMDDDAEPQPDALEQLAAVATEPGNLYGSLAVNGADICWRTVLRDSGQAVTRAADVPAAAAVDFIPFLGILVHRDMVARIGLPDAGFFIAADDLEYSMRARRAGARVIIAGRSRITHPKAQHYEARLPGRTLYCLRLPPWKRYYDTRNRLLIAREYFGLRLLTQTLPSLFIRLYATLRNEPDRRAQLWAFFAGLTDGLLARKGRRHTQWKIQQ